MAIFEFVCPVHGKFERIVPSTVEVVLCPTWEDAEGEYCLRHSEKVEFSVPARRNPEHGIQK